MHVDVIGISSRAIGFWGMVQLKIANFFLEELEELFGDFKPILFHMTLWQSNIAMENQWASPFLIW